MHAPEGLWVELIHELFECAAVGVAFDGSSDYADRSFFDGSEADLALVHEEQAVLSADDYLAGMGLWRLGLLFHQPEQCIELGITCGFDGCSASSLSFFDGLHDTFAVEGFEQIVDRIDLKGTNGILVEGSGEDYLRHGHTTLEQLFQD